MSKHSRPEPAAYPADLIHAAADAAAICEEHRDDGKTDDERPVVTAEVGTLVGKDGNHPAVAAIDTPDGIVCVLAASRDDAEDAVAAIVDEHRSGS